MNGATIPTVKVERVPSPHVKPEPADNTLSPYMDEDDVYEEDAGDLDFSKAQQQLWLSRIPRSLWETWSSLGDEEEIEIGTIRVEGTETEPQRVGSHLVSSSSLILLTTFSRSVSSYITYLNLRYIPKSIHYSRQITTEHESRSREVRSSFRRKICLGTKDGLSP
jgi:TFIIF, beta subunit N-terminus